MIHLQILHKLILRMKFSESEKYASFVTYIPSKILDIYLSIRKNIRKSILSEEIIAQL